MTDSATAAKSEASTKPNWDREQRTSFGKFSVPGRRGRQNRYEVFGESTVKGEHPPRFRVIVRGVSGAHVGEETTVENLEAGGFHIENQGMFSELGELMQDTISGLAIVGASGMVRGWNSGLERGYQQGLEKGREVGAAEEKERAAEVRRAQGAATRAIHDAVQQEARDTGRDPSDVLHDHTARIVRERRESRGKAAGGRGE